MRIVAIIGNVVLALLVLYIFVEEGMPSKLPGQILVVTMLFTSIASIVALVFEKTSRITELKRQVQEAELERQLKGLRKESQATP